MVGLKIRGSDSYERARAEERVLQTQQISLDGVSVTTRDARFAGRGGVTDMTAQLGQMLSTERFMEKLRRVNRDIIMTPHPHQPGIGCLYLVVGDQKVYLFPCESDWMPEWSVMAEDEAREPVHEVHGHWQKVTVPGREIKRGWRTVLLRLVQRRIVTLDAVEREFGPGDRVSYAVLTGKRHEMLPIG
jgi:hypothetical protein